MQNHVAALVSKFGEYYPGCWLAVDRLRESGRSDLEAWPPYCFLPTRAAHYVVSGGVVLSHAQRIPKTGDMQRMAVLSAWRVTQRIYRFDETLFDALWQTPVRKVPAALFKRLPEWCIYIELPKPPYRGAFVHLDHHGVPPRDQLRIVFDKIDGTLNDLMFMAMSLDYEDIYEGLKAVAAAHAEGLQRAGFKGENHIDDVTMSMLGSVASLVLYLCSLDADFEQPMKPAAKRTKQGMRIFPPAAPKLIDVGTRIGAVLRNGMKQISENGDESGVSVRPHVRRAHHHHYWIGPKANQELVVKWLWPILVNIDKGEISPTIRPVKD